MSDKQERIQSYLDHFGVDVDLENTDYEISKAKFSSQEILEINVTRPVLAHKGENTVDFSRTMLAEDGTQVKLNVAKRPKCPNCGYIPVDEEDTPQLRGRCGECGDWRCSECGTECSVCNRLLCKYCSDGYPGRDDDVLCPKHRRDQERERRFEAQMEMWEMELKEETQLRESETERAARFAEIELQIEEQREQRKLEAEIQRRKQKLEEFETRSKHLERQKEQELEEKKLELERAEKQMEYSLEQQKQALEEEIERRKRSLEEYKAVANALLEKQELEAEKKKQKRSHELEQEKHKLNKEIERRETRIKELESQIDAVHDRRMNRLEEWDELIDLTKSLKDLEVPEVEPEEREKAQEIIDADYEVLE